MSVTKATSTSRLPFWKEWKEKRAQKKREQEEAAARDTTDKIAENENTIIGVLEDIDFRHSKLPESVLEYKTKEEHPCGDLEYAAKALALYLKKNPQEILLDIREIDEKILQLARMFKYAVEAGEPTTANATKEFLLRGIRDIRTKVPTASEEIAKLYVTTHVKYLATCIDYCELARAVDQWNNEVIVDKDTLVPMEEEYKEKVTQYKEEILADPEKAKLAKIIAETYNQAQRATWTEEVRQLHMDMIDLALSEVSVGLQRVKLNQDEIKLTEASNRLSILLIRVNQLPLVTDPNEMNKFLKSVDEIFEEIAAADQQIDESMRTIEEINERIKQVDSLPGAVRAKEIASEKMKTIIEEIKQEQDQAAKKNEEDSAYRSLGIKSKEEMEQLKQEQEKQESEMFESMMNIN